MSVQVEELPVSYRPPREVLQFDGVFVGHPSGITTHVESLAVDTNKCSICEGEPIWTANVLQ